MKVLSSKAASFVLKPVTSHEDLKRANDLIAKAADTDYWSALRWLESCGAKYPEFRLEHTRTAFVQNAIVGALRLTTGTIRIGEARLRMGGLGSISVSGPYRRMGICSALINDSLDYMRDHGYHVSLLFRDEDFYRRFGFSMSIPEHEMLLDTLEASAAATLNHRLRLGKPGDIPAIQRIHNQNDLCLSCSLVRTSAHLANTWEHWKGVRVVTTAAGKVVGYFAFHLRDGAFCIDEVGVSDDESCESVLAACASLATEKMLARLALYIHPMHPLSRFLRNNIYACQTCLPRSGAGLMAVVDIAETLESMVPEWESLLADTSLRDARVELTLVVDGSGFRIRANRGAVDVSACYGINKVTVTAEGLAHMLSGCSAPEDILAETRRLMKADSRELFVKLFPERNPFVSRMDRF